MPYAQYSQAALLIDIANLLSDPTVTYWSAQEIRYAIREALREWSGICSYWRERSVVTGTASARYQDLGVNLLPGRSRATTYDSLIREIQYHFHEPSTGVAGTGMSQQFNISTILAAIQKARNKFVVDSGIPTSWVADQPIVPNSSGRYTLPNNVAILRNLRWVENGLYYPLFPMDPWSFDNTIFANTTRPIGYSFVEGMPNEITLFPNPINPGALEIIAVLNDFSLITDVWPLGIPDDFAHAVKYATMADLVGSDSESFDPFIADYCEKRYQTTLASARQQLSIISVLVNGVRIRIDSLSQLNRGFPNWTVQTTNSPTGTMLAGSEYDLLAFYKRPAQDFSLTVDYVQAAPIPINDAAFIQVGGEDISNMTDYAQHYLSLKLGGREFKDTFNLYESFQANALRNAGLLAATSSYLANLLGRGAQELSTNLLRRRPDRDPIPLLERK